jgi:hypothetical protein
MRRDILNLPQWIEAGIWRMDKTKQANFKESACFYVSIYT